jgi:hypothetical protein
MVKIRFRAGIMAQANFMLSVKPRARPSAVESFRAMFRTLFRVRSKAGVCFRFRVRAWVKLGIGWPWAC